MTKLTLPGPVLGALRELGVLEDELLAVVNEAAAKDPALKESGEAVTRFIEEKVSPHLGIAGAKAIAASVLAQILGGKPGFDPDASMDS